MYHINSRADDFTSNIRIQYYDVEGEEKSVVLRRRIPTTSKRGVKMQPLPHLSAKPDYPNYPLFDIMVTVHDYPERSSVAAGPLETKGPGFNRSSFLGSSSYLIAEFTVLDSGRIIRLEHDLDCIVEDEIALIQAKITRTLALICRETAREDLKELANVDPLMDEGNG